MLELNYKSNRKKVEKEKWDISVPALKVNVPSDSGHNKIELNPAVASLLDWDPNMSKTIGVGNIDGITVLVSGVETADDSPVYTVANSENFHFYNKKLADTLRKEFGKAPEESFYLYVTKNENSTDDFTVMSLNLTVTENQEENNVIQNQEENA